MSTKNRNIKKTKQNKKQHCILKRLLRLDMVKRMCRHNENDECNILYYFILVYITCVSPIC